MARGWHNHPREHSLAARGIKINKTKLKKKTATRAKKKIKSKVKTKIKQIDEKYITVGGRSRDKSDDENRTKRGRNRYERNRATRTRDNRERERGVKKDKKGNVIEYDTRGLRREKYGRKDRLRGGATSVETEAESKTIIGEKQFNALADSLQYVPIYGKKVKKMGKKRTGPRVIKWWNGGTGLSTLDYSLQHPDDPMRDYDVTLETIKTDTLYRKLLHLRKASGSKSPSYDLEEQASVAKRRNLLTKIDSGQPIPVPFLMYDEKNSLIKYQQEPDPTLTLLLRDAYVETIQIYRFRVRSEAKKRKEAKAMEMAQTTEKENKKDKPNSNKSTQTAEEQPSWVDIGKYDNEPIDNAEREDNRSRDRGRGTRTPQPNWYERPEVIARQQAQEAAAIQIKQQKEFDEKVQKAVAKEVAKSQKNGENKWTE